MSNKGNIKIVNIKNAAYDVYIGRANKHYNLPKSKWHNPIVLKKESDRELCLAEYELYIRSNTDLIAALPELKNKILGCYCHPKRLPW